jgi:hypothetical protein
LRTCVECGKSYEPVRSDSRYCKKSCKQKALRRRRLEAEIGAPVQRPVGTEMPDLSSFIADVVGRTAAETLRLSLTALRRERVPFHRAWPVCLAHVGRDREMLQELQDAFQAGFERHPTSVAALSELREVA